MPSLGADMEAATLIEWLKQPGDPVKRGDIVAVVETDKGAIEIEIFDNGVLEELLVEPGTKIPVGTPLARLKGTSEGGVAEPAPAPPVVETSAPPAPRMQAVAPPGEDGRLRISPVAARRAAELGIDPRRITGTGDRGAIVLGDVEAARAGTGAEAPKQAVETDPRMAMRRAIAAAMSRANREIPHYHLDQSIDMAAAMGWLSETNRERPVDRRLLPGVLLLKATALALKQAPELNGYWSEGQSDPREDIHIGWATSLRGGGLIAPAIRDAARRSIDELMAALRDAVGRARSGGLRGSELSDATITVTSLGERGADAVHGVVYPPQVALVGFGAIGDRPRAIDGAVVVRPTVTATLSADHRASDGQRGGRFLNALDALLQEPERL